MPVIRLTATQSKAVETFLAAFLSGIERYPALPLPPTLSVALKVIQAAIRANDSLEPHEFDLLIGVMDIYFEGIDPYEEIWPGLEQAYARLQGHWPYEVPWYTRAVDNAHLVGISYVHSQRKRYRQ